MNTEPHAAGGVTNPAPNVGPLHANSAGRHNPAPGDLQPADSGWRTVAALPLNPARGNQQQ